MWQLSWINCNKYGYMVKYYNTLFAQNTNPINWKNNTVKMLYHRPHFLIQHITEKRIERGRETHISFL